MVESSPLLDADALKLLLSELANELEADDSAGQLFLVGGAAMALDWLNDAVKAFLPGTNPNATTIIDHPALQVQVAAPDYLSP